MHVLYVSYIYTMRIRFENVENYPFFLCINMAYFKV